MKFFKNSLVFYFTLLLLATFLFQACEDSPTRQREPDFSTVPEPYNIQNADTSYTKDGVEIHIIEEGYGPFEVIPRDQIQLYYTGRTIENEIEIFESTYANDNDDPTVISNLRPIITGQQRPPVEGFRRGLLGMKEGEKRVIIVPDSLGYDNSRPGPRNMDLRNHRLRYDVELEGIL